MRQFEYLAPATTTEALEALRSYGEAAILAGGTDLVPRLKMRERAPAVLIDIKRIQPLHALAAAREGLSLGSCVTMARVCREPDLRSVYGALADGAAVVGSAQIRNRATVAGNICNASPSADTAPALLALGASVRVARAGAERCVPLAEFFVGPGQTALRPDELVLAVDVPAPPVASGSAYARHSTRAAMDLAAVGVAVWLHLEADGITCRDAAVALGAVAPTPVRVPAAEDRLRGCELAPALVSEAAAYAADAARPITDVRASAEFRREITRCLTGRMIQAAAAAARDRLAAVEG